MSKAIPTAGLSAHCTSLHKHWDRSVAPAHVVASGATIAMTCPDASNGSLSASSTAAAIATIDFSYLDPLCGPIFPDRGLHDSAPLVPAPKLSRLSLTHLPALDEKLMKSSLCHESSASPRSTRHSRYSGAAGSLNSAAGSSNASNVSAVLTGMGPLHKADLKARPPAFSPLRAASFMLTRRLGGGLLGAPSRTHRRPKSLATGTSAAPIWEIHPLWF